MRKIILLTLVFSTTAYADEGGLGLFGRVASGAAGMVARTAGQSYSDAAEKHASEDPGNAEAIRSKTKVGIDALKSAEEKSFEAAKTGKR